MSNPENSAFNWSTDFITLKSKPVESDHTLYFGITDFNIRLDKVEDLIDEIEATANGQTNYQIRKDVDGDGDLERIHFVRGISQDLDGDGTLEKVVRQPSITIIDNIDGYDNEQYMENIRIQYSPNKNFADPNDSDDLNDRETYFITFNNFEGFLEGSTPKHIQRPMNIELLITDSKVEGVNLLESARLKMEMPNSRPWHTTEIRNEMDPNSNSVIYSWEHAGSYVNSDETYQDFRFLDIPQIKIDF